MGNLEHSRRVWRFGRVRGTSLVEVAVAIVIVGVAILAMVQFVGTATAANRTLSDQNVAISIAQAAHEWSKGQRFSRMKANFTLNPDNTLIYAPTSLLEASGIAAEALQDGDASRGRVYNPWSEVLTMQYVSDQDLTTPDPTHLSNTVQITVDVKKKGQSVLKLTRVYGVTGA